MTAIRIGDTVRVPRGGGCAVPGPDARVIAIDGDWVTVRYSDGSTGMGPAARWERRCPA